MTGLLNLKDALMRCAELTAELAALQKEFTSQNLKWGNAEKECERLRKIEEAAKAYCIMYSRNSSKEEYYKIVRHLQAQFPQTIYADARAEGGEGKT